MTPAEFNAIMAGMVTLLSASLAYLTAKVRANTDTLKDHTATLSDTSTGLTNKVASLTASIDTMRSGGGDRRRAGAAAPGPPPPRPYPVWNQLDDPVSGVLPQWRYEECGEECVSMVIWEQHGVEVTADALRVLLGGPGRRGLTNGDDLVKILTRCNVAATKLPVSLDSLERQVRAATSERRSMICLGGWVQPETLHWVLVTRADENGCSFNDPWGGVRRSLTWDSFKTLYRGELVCVLRSPDP